MGIVSPFSKKKHLVRYGPLQVILFSEDPRVHYSEFLGRSNFPYPVHRKFMVGFSIEFLRDLHYRGAQARGNVNRVEIEWKNQL